MSTYVCSVTVSGVATGAFWALVLTTAVASSTATMDITIIALKYFLTIITPMSADNAKRPQEGDG
jgi:hypothetical protein